jgi:hypothetical protein
MFLFFFFFSGDPSDWDRDNNDLEETGNLNEKLLKSQKLFLRFGSATGVRPLKASKNCLSDGSDISSPTGNLTITRTLTSGTGGDEETTQLVSYSRSPSRSLSDSYE